MGFTIYLGVTNKRFNSTRQDDYTGWTKTTAVWKNSKDIDNPTIEFQFGNVFPNWNYMYIPAHAAYYWITRIESVRAGVWSISATMDVLATFRSDIVSTPAYIEYGFNTDQTAVERRLADVRQNVAAVPTVKTVTADVTGGTVSITNGCYILSAVGASGGVTVWRVGQNDMPKLLQSVGTDITNVIGDMDDVNDVIKYIGKNALTQGSAISAIRSCIWLPIQPQYIEVASFGNVFLGDFDTGVPAYTINAKTVVKAETDVAIPWITDDWRRLNSQIIVYVPFVGTVGIPVDQCNGASKLHFTWCTEVLNGGVSVRIDADDYPVYTGSAQIGSSYAIGSSNVPTSNFISGSIQAIGGAITAGAGVLSSTAGVGLAVATGGVMGGDMITSGAAGVASGVTDMASGAVQALTPVVQCAGSLSGNAALGQSMLAKVVLLYYPPIDDTGFKSVYGFPVMRMGTPVAGYCKTRGFSIGGNQRLSEKCQIMQMMDSGVFIE